MVSKHRVFFGQSSVLDLIQWGKECSHVVLKFPQISFSIKNRDPRQDGTGCQLGLCSQK